MRLILFFLALVGIFVSGSLFFRLPYFRNRTLSFFIILFSFQVLNFLYGTSEIFYLYPQFIGFYFYPSSFLFGPLFYLHLLSFKEQAPNIWQKIIHFLPSLIMILLIRDVYQIDNGIARMELITDQFGNRFLIYNYAIVVHIILYACASFFMLRKFIRGLKHSERLYIIGIAIIYLVSGIMLGLYVEYANSWRDFSPYYLMVSVCFLIIGFLLFANPKFLNDFSKKYLSSNLNKDEMKQIVSDLAKLFETEKVFLERGLTVKKVSTLLGIPSYKISQSLSTFSGTNFNEFCNKYRVKYSEDLLKDLNLQHYKIEAIALDSGFSNKVTFYRAFMKINGFTPASFRDNSCLKS